MTQQIDCEVIKVKTPLYLAGAGTLIALVALIVPGIQPEKANAAFGIAGTAIAAAAGLAQSNGKNEENQLSLENNGLQVEQNNSPTTEATERLSTESKTPQSYKKLGDL